MLQEAPKYRVVAEWAKKQIDGTQLRPGDKFYSETELCRRFGFSRQTIRQAIGLLEREGFLERKRGAGTYLAGKSAGEITLSKTIGVISTYVDSYIFPAIIRGISGVLAETGYAVQLSLTNNKVENESRALNSLLSGNVIGIIAEPTQSGLPNPNTELYWQIRERKIPLIFFNAYYPNMDFPHVCLDDHLAGKMAAEYLIGAGHKKIAGMFQSDDRQGHLRYAGYIQALQRAGLDVESSNILWFTTEDIPFLREDITRLRRRFGNCTGLVCYNDAVAYIVVSELRERGVLVPEELSVVGIDGAEIGLICPVPLTTFAHPMEKLGEVAAKNILKLIENPGFEATVDFAPRLIERESVRFIC
ncbi:GntR family transcriptional regulator [Synergistales bacterium]|nr:GntR family transcriptional regulator [Synergistales bacterium]